MALFFLNGAVFSSWYARLPAIQADIGLGPGALGIALLGAPLGLLLAQPLAGAVIARRGSRMLLHAAPLYLMAAVLPALAGAAGTLLLAVLVVGAANGVLDIAMNAQGLGVERALRRRLINALHAAFSFGALTGAGAAGLAAAWDLDPLAHLALWVGAGALASVPVTRLLLPDGADARPEAPRFARPSRRLGALGAIAFCALLAEGAVFDWSAVYLARDAGAPEGLAPVGLAAFSGAMGLGRLTGDRLATGLGDARAAGWGAGLAALGLACALAVASPAAGIAGFAVMGLGLSVVFPLVLRASGRDAEGAGPALAAVSTVGYMGFLSGPAVIGLLAESAGLRAALVLVPVLCLVAALLTPHIGGRRARTPAPA